MNRPRLLLYALTAVVAGTVLFASATSGTAYGAYNFGWDGSSSLREQADAVGADFRVALGTDTYAEVPAEDTVAVVLAPEATYGPADTARVRRFLDRGGTLVVAGDFGGSADRLLASVNASARLDGRLLRDERVYYRVPAMPIAPNLADRPLGSGVERLTLNYATAVRPGDAAVLANTSRFGYLDANRNGGVDEDETLGRYPVSTVERVGDGRVVVVGDPSLFINAMLDRPNNARFVRNLFAGSERVLADHSHGGGVPPLVAGVFFVREWPVGQALAGAVVVAAITVWFRRADGRERSRASRGEKP